MVNLFQRVTTPLSRAVNTVRSVGKRGITGVGNVWNTAGRTTSGTVSNLGKGANKMLNGVFKSKRGGRRMTRKRGGRRMTRKMKKNLKKTYKNRR